MGTMPDEAGEGIFEAKLDALPNTIALCSQETIAPVSQAMDIGRSLRAVAVGSGGSLAAAHFLATCRRDVSDRPTSVQTPMEFVLGLDDLSDAQVWLFTGRGQNPDIAAALSAADARGAADIRVVTANAYAPLATYHGRYRQPRFHVIPVADPKDGFLSTHTLVAFVTHLLLATDQLVEVPRPAVDGVSVQAQLADRLSSVRRQDARIEWRRFRPEDTLLILGDPSLTAASAQLETSLWETAIAPVQRTDLRNFAHGRHIWPARRADRTALLVLTTNLSRGVWDEIDAQLPSSLRRHVVDYGSGGRLQAALAVLDGLVAIAAMGLVVGIDPGKPSAALYAKPIYEAQALYDLSARLSAPVRHKLSATLRADGPEQDVARNFEVFLNSLSARRYRGLVLDYDGTVVATHMRKDPPSSPVLEQLRRLLADGMKLAIATGRGGSSAEALREALDPELQGSVIMGYYNGGHILPLGKLLHDYPAPEHRAISAISDAVSAIANAYETKPRIRGSQISLDFGDDELSELTELLLALPEYQAGEVRLVRSQHSIDIVPAATSKLNVVMRLATAFGLQDGEILCIGDSGQSIGNDHDLLGHPSGLSVDKVCSRPGVCWAPFGSNLRGPQALVRILDGLVKDGTEGFRLDLDVITASAAQ